MIGSTVAHYRIIEKLGAGGMGEVFKAEDLTLGRVVALKFLPPTMAGDRHAIERLRREARAASVLNHPGICTIHAIEEIDGQQFIAMEFLDGQPLSAMIANGPLPMTTLVPLAIQIADALETAHGHGVVHRDIKPANIFITRRQQAKILDFGLVKVAGGQDHGLTMGSEALTTTPGMTVGTIAYMSPEQARGEVIDARTDLFSFGLVLYEMATGRRAFGGTTTAIVFDAILNRTPPPAAGVNPDIPAELDRIIAKAVEKDRDLRYQNAVDVRTDLQRLKRDGESSVRIPVASSASAVTPAMAASAAGPVGSASSVAPVSAAVPQFQVPPSGTVAVASGWSRGLMLGALVVIIALIAVVAYLGGRIQGSGGASEQASAPAPPATPAATPTPGPVGADLQGRPLPTPTPESVRPTTSSSATNTAAPSPTATAPPAVEDERAKAAKAATAATAEIEDIRSKLAANQNAQAIAAAMAFIERNPANRLTADAYMLLGQAYEASKRDDEAATAYAAVVEKFKTSPRAPEALFRQAQRVFRSRQPQKETLARNLYSQVADGYPKTEWAPRALIARAEIEERMRERVMDQTVATYVPFSLLTYRAISERYPSYSEDALWKMSEMLEDLNRYPLQAQALTDLVARFPQTKYDAAWKLGEIREKRLKNKPGAIEAYARVPAASPKYRDAQKKVQELQR